MKKRILVLCIAAVFLLTACTNGSGGSSSGSSSAATASYSGKGSGFGGELEVEVTVNNGKIENLTLTKHHESDVVIERAFPMLKERILNAQSPIIDSVSGATYSSFGVKTAVAEAMKTQGKDFGQITITTKAENPQTPSVEDTQTQLVIVGGGPAGLSAAITAKENGVKDVLVIEKLDILSGNGKFDLNFYDVFNSLAQKENGIEDSVEKFITDKQDAGETPERLKVWAEGESVIDQWLRSFGVELNYNYGGRNHMADKDNYAGPVIQKGLENKANELNVEIRTGTKGVDLIFDGDKVAGVVAEHMGHQYKIMADAVIIATGGFSANKELLSTYAPGYEVLNTSNQIGATGDFVPLFEKYNFQLHNMDTIRVIPTIILPSRDLTNSGAGSIFVNRNGKRFVNERLGGLEMGKAILEQETVWMIVDTQKFADNANVRKQIRLGKFEEAKTLEELADNIGVNKENLVATVKEYNTFAEKQAADAFGQVPERPLLQDGPYYAVRVESAVHMTKGGVVANQYGQILYKDGNIVPGLYGAGEVTWQSGGYSQSVVFGRVAGENAAKAVTA